MSAESLKILDSSRIRQLGRMLDLDATVETDTWQREDFSAILEHQLEGSAGNRAFGNRFADRIKP